MAVSFYCKCEERKRPPEERDWVITQFRCNHSAFNGYHRTPSDYSTVACRRCGAVGRTNANYVYDIWRWQREEATLGERNEHGSPYKTPRDKAGPHSADPLVLRLREEKPWTDPNFITPEMGAERREVPGED